MAIDRALHLFSDSRALRVGYYTDQTKYVDFVATSAGGLTITPAVAAQTITLANTAALSVAGTLAVTGVATFTAGFVATTGKSYIGDTSNADITTGLTINQGGADDQIMAFKSSDVAHGMTSVTETDTYASFAKFSATAGGGHIRGFSETTTGLQLGGSHTTDNTTKTTAGTGCVHLTASLSNGAGGAGNCGADANLVVIRNNGTTRFIFDAEGSGHADVEWTTFDEHDDLAVIEDMESILAPGQVQRRFGEVVKHDRAFFERAGLLHDVRETEPGRMRGMLNMTRATMLSFGAIRQVGGQAVAIETAVRELLAANPQLDGAGEVLALLGG